MTAHRHSAQMGRKFFFERADSSGNYNYDIFVINVDGTGLAQLTNDPRTMKLLPGVPMEQKSRLHPIGMDTLRFI